MRRLFAATVMAAVLTACNNSGCLENQSAVPLAGFYDSATDETVVLDSLMIYGIGAPGDSSLIAGRAGTVYLPLRSAAESTSFCFRYLQKDLDIPALNDTLTFDYTSEPRFVSEECGAMYFYHITGYRCTDHLIDSVVVTNPEITNFDTERIRVYFRVAAEEEEENPEDGSGDSASDNQNPQES